MPTEENNNKYMMDDKLKKEIELIVRKENRFTVKKTSDTPTDAIQVVNRRYVTLNGTVANRPVSSVAVVGQHYLATDTSIPMVYTAAGWVNGIGSIVALNN